MVDDNFICALREHGDSGHRTEIRALLEGLTVNQLRYIAMRILYPLRATELKGRLIEELVRWFVSSYDWKVIIYGRG